MPLRIKELSRMFFAAGQFDFDVSKNRLFKMRSNQAY